MNGKQVCSVCLLELKEDDLIVRNTKDPSGGLVWNKNGDMHVACYKKRKKSAVLGYGAMLLVLAIAAIVVLVIVL